MGRQERIKVAFASGTDELNSLLIEKIRGLFPELPLYVVSEFRPGASDCIWIRYHRNRPWENLARCRAAFRGKAIRLAGVLLVPNVPFRFMRFIALRCAPLYFLAVNEHMNDFLLRPQSAPAVVRHMLWRTGNFFRWHFGAKGTIRTTDWGLKWLTMAAHFSGLFHVRRASGQGKLGSLLPVRTNDKYLRFLATSVYDRRVFLRLWREAIDALSAEAASDPTARRVLRRAWRFALMAAPAKKPSFPEHLTLAMADGSVNLFSGRAASGKPCVLVASPYMPFPLSHGGAVRMYNLMRRAADEFDQILVVFTENDAPPPDELTAICIEVVTVRRSHTHSPPWRGRPEVVEEFASLAFEGALLESLQRWHPQITQLEFTQMAQYAATCAPARTILVEHDVTFDLCEQLSKQDGGWDAQRQADLWKRFETKAWGQVDRVVTMSEKDRQLVGAGNAVTLPNGVDLERFQPEPPGGVLPEPGRVLFIGSFAHLPNLLALEFFLKEVRPLLEGTRLHVIAGQRHEYYLDHYRHLTLPDLAQPGIELEGFVTDVRAAYARASVVILPLVASAGTNIKVLEAMAAGKAIVSTPAGVNGLELIAGKEFLLAGNAAEMAAAIRGLLDDTETCACLGAAARLRAEESFGWDAIAREQAEMYRGLLAS